MSDEDHWDKNDGSKHDTHEQIQTSSAPKSSRKTLPLFMSNELHKIIMISTKICTHFNHCNHNYININNINNMLIYKK